MTQVQFDFAVDTADGSYLGFYTTGLVNPQSIGIATNTLITDLDMTLNRADVRIDGSYSVIRDGQSVGYLDLRVANQTQRYPVQVLLYDRANAGTKDRFRVRLGPAYVFD